MSLPSSRKKLFIIAALLFVTFFSFVYWNYSQTQKSLRETKQSVLEIKNITTPSSLKVGERGIFTWEVQAPSDFSTTFTTIYWSNASSPSALTKSDSPAAVGYSHFELDYTKGKFSLPDTFTLSISFDKPEKIYYRSYAKVGEDHLWSDEKSITIAP